MSDEVGEGGEGGEGEVGEGGRKKVGGMREGRSGGRR